MTAPWFSFNAIDTIQIQHNTLNTDTIQIHYCGTDSTQCSRKLTNLIRQKN